MFEHNGIMYYSENEIKSKFAEVEKRRKKYSKIRAFLIILLSLSLAANIHYFFLYKTAQAVLNSYAVSDELDYEELQSEADTSLSSEEKQLKKKHIEEERNKIKSTLNSIEKDKRGSEILKITKSKVNEMRSEDTAKCPENSDCKESERNLGENLTD